MSHPLSAHITRCTNTLPDYNGSVAGIASVAKASLDARLSYTAARSEAVAACGTSEFEAAYDAAIAARDAMWRELTARDDRDLTQLQETGTLSADHTLADLMRLANTLGLDLGTVRIKGDLAVA